MLILTRKIGGKVSLRDRDNGREVEIEVLAIDGRQVSLGFTADRAVEIFRAELLPLAPAAAPPAPEARP